MNANALIVDRIQEQMNQAAEAINAKAYPAARVAFLECAALCEILDSHTQADALAKKNKPKQLTIDV